MPKPGTELTKGARKSLYSSAPEGARQSGRLPAMARSRSPCYKLRQCPLGSAKSELLKLRLLFWSRRPEEVHARPRHRELHHASWHIIDSVCTDGLFSTAFRLSGQQIGRVPVAHTRLDDFSAPIHGRVCNSLAACRSHR